MCAEIYVSEKLREFEAERASKAGSPVRRRPTLDIVPGKEEEFRYLRSWLAASDRLDRLIAATEPPDGPELVSAPAPTPSTGAQPVTAHADTPSPRRLPSEARWPGMQPVVGPLVRRAGHALRRIGEALEAWGTAPRTRVTDARYSAGS